MACKLLRPHRSPDARLLGKGRVCAMATSLDSIVVFEQRAREIGANDDEIGRLRTLNWNSFASFAFSPASPSRLVDFVCDMAVEDTLR